MKPIQLNDPSEIQEFLYKISFTGKGFTSDSLLLEVSEAGLDYPDFLKAEGEDPDAHYDGKSHAWAKYHVRQGKMPLWKRIYFLQKMRNPKKILHLRKCQRRCTL